MSGSRRFKIDAFAESAYRNIDCDAIVCIDVVLAATTAVTCLARGRRVFLVRTPDEARGRAFTLQAPILAHEQPRDGLHDFLPLAGPAILAHRADVRRPLVLVSPLAHLLANADAGPAVYVACLRNVSATVRHLCARHDRVALIGAGYGGELRFEDQLAAAWMGGALAKSGFAAEDRGTFLEVERWTDADPAVLALGKAADYLRRLGQEQDLDFVMGHLDDLDLVARYVGGELTVAEQARKRAPLASVGRATPAELAAVAHLSGMVARDIEAERELEAQSLEPST